MVGQVIGDESGKDRAGGLSRCGWRLGRLFFLMMGLGAVGWMPTVTAAEPVDSAEGWLEPGDNWTVDYAAAECRLIRNFGGPEPAIQLEVVRGLVFDGYGWSLYGRDLPALPAKAGLTVALDPQAVTRRAVAEVPAITGRPEKAIKWFDADQSMTGTMRDDQRLRVTGDGDLDVGLRLSGMRQAVKALDSCHADLLAGWGIDPALPVRPEPANHPALWATTDDYPPADRAQKNEGTVTFLLDISKSGKTEKCRIMVGSGWPTLDVRTCELMLGRARFRPARDATGAAVRGHYVNRVRWALPG